MYDSSINNESILFSFDMGSFIERLKELYAIYSAWIYLTNPGLKASIKLAGQLSGLDKYNAWCNSEKDARRVIKNSAFNAEVGVRIRVKNEVLFQEIIAKTPIDAAYIQLFDVITSPLALRTIADCQNCKQPFIKTHGNKRLCPNCDSNKEILRAYRARKKAGV